MTYHLKLFWLLLLISIRFSAISQNYIEYYDYVNEGEFKYNSGLFEDAIKAYEYAFSIESPLGIDIYRMARCQCQKGNTKETLKYLKLTGQKYFLQPNIYFTRDSLVFTNCLSAKQFTDIKYEMTTDCIQNFSKLSNSENYKILVDTTNYFVEEDQKYRKKENNPCLDGEDKNYNCDSINNEWFKHDSILYNQFIQFIKENGYPRIAGELSYVILLHFNDPEYRKSKQILIDEVNKGNIDPFFLGMMFERLDLLLYGRECTYYIWRTECTKEEWNQIIANRKAIGMSIYYNGPRVRGEYNRKKLPWVSSE